jgi:hypothetical protein
MPETIRPEPSDQERSRPDLRKLRRLLQGPFDIKSLALTGLFVLAAFSCRSSWPCC